MSERYKPEQTNNQLWNAMDQHPFSSLKQTIGAGKFKDADGFERMLWVLADLGKGSYRDDPEVRVPEDRIKKELGYAGPRIGKIKKLMPLLKRSLAWSTASETTRALNEYPFCLAYLNYVKCSGLFRTNWEIRDLKQREYIIDDYEKYRERIENLHFDGIIEDRPTYFNENRIREVAPDKKPVNRWFRRLGTTRDRENEV